MTLNERITKAIIDSGKVGSRHKVLSLSVEAIKQDLMGLPELQSEWEEDLRGTPNPNGAARNELRSTLRKAIEEYTK